MGEGQVTHLQAPDKLVLEIYLHSQAKREAVVSRRNPTHSCLQAPVKGRSSGQATFALGS